MSTTPEQESPQLDPVTHDPISTPEPEAAPEQSIEAPPEQPIEAQPEQPAEPAIEQPAATEQPSDTPAEPEATNADNHPVDPGPQAQPTGDIEPPLVGESLPDGTAYVTPDGVIGVVGVEHDYQRPLRGSYFEAIMAFSHEVRKESTYH